MSSNKQQREDKARVKRAILDHIAGKTTVTVAEIRHHVLDKTALDFSGPVLARYLNTYGWERVRSADVGCAGAYYQAPADWQLTAVRLLSAADVDTPRRPRRRPV